MPLYAYIRVDRNWCECVCLHDINLLQFQKSPLRPLNFIYLIFPFHLYFGYLTENLQCPSVVATLKIISAKLMSFNSLHPNFNAKQSNSFCRLLNEVYKHSAQERVLSIESIRNFINFASIDIVLNEKTVRLTLTLRQVVVALVAIYLAPIKNFSNFN